MSRIVLPTVDEGVERVLSALDLADKTGPFDRTVSRVYKNTGVIREFVFADCLWPMTELNSREFNLRPACRKYRDLVIQAMLDRNLIVEGEPDPFRTFKRKV